MEHLTQITLTDSERSMLHKALDVVSTFMLSLHGDMGNEEDAKNVKYVLDHPKEFEALIRKLGKDILE